MCYVDVCRLEPHVTMTSPPGTGRCGLLVHHLSMLLLILASFAHTTFSVPLPSSASQNPGQIQGQLGQG